VVAELFLCYPLTEHYLDDPGFCSVSPMCYGLNRLNITPEIAPASLQQLLTVLSEVLTVRSWTFFIYSILTCHRRTTPRKTSLHLSNSLCLKESYDGYGLKERNMWQASIRMTIQRSRINQKRNENAIYEAKTKGRMETRGLPRGGIRRIELH